VRALGLDPVRDTRRAFRALCDATSRPGTVVSVAADPADHAVVATLVDHEVTTWTPDERLREALENQGRLDAASPTSADVVHAIGRPDWDVRECDRGTLVEPSEGATVVYRVDDLGDADDPGLTGVELAGPGVDGTRRVGVGLRAGELERLAEAQSTYPRGVDAYFAVGERVAAIPRSSELEVL
jgi:alpha-D-ribose 1-methylphosphonate 5-triphosphate synthase subunit PhnH